MCFLAPIIINSFSQSNNGTLSGYEAFFYQIPILASVCTNPIIYVVMNTQYTTAYYQLIGGFFK